MDEKAIELASAILTAWRLDDALCALVYCMILEVVASGDMRLVG